MALDDNADHTLFAHCAGLTINAVHDPVVRGPGKREHALRLATALNLDMSEQGFVTGAPNFFGRVTKATILASVAEAKGEETANLLADLKKKDMAAEATRRGSGSPNGRPSCCPYPTSMWSTRCPHPSLTSPIRTEAKICGSSGHGRRTGPLGVRRSQAAWRAHRHHLGAAHLGLGHDASPACAYDRARRRSIRRRPALDQPEGLTTSCPSPCCRGCSGGLCFPCCSKRMAKGASSLALFGSYVAAIPKRLQGRSLRITSRRHGRRRDASRGSCRGISWLPR